MWNRAGSPQRQRRALARAQAIGLVITHIFLDLNKYFFCVLQYAVKYLE